MKVEGVNVYDIADQYLFPRGNRVALKRLPVRSEGAGGNDELDGLFQNFGVHCAHPFTAPENAPERIQRWAMM